MGTGTGRYRLVIFGIVILVAVFSLATVVLAAAGPAGDTPGRYIVIFDDEDAKQGTKQFIKQKGGKVLADFRIVSGMTVEIGADKVSGLKKLKGVREVGPDVKVYALDTELERSWGVKRIGAGTVHGYNTGSGTSVAVVDTGIDYTHPDLDANYAGGYDFVNNDFDPIDDNGHGTHVAGIIAAEDNDSGVVGVAPGASVYALKVLDSSGSGYLSNIIAALDWVFIENQNNPGRWVVNMSLGSSSGSDALHAAIIKAYDAGIILVAAAGNSGRPNGKGDSIEYPARYPEVIAVGATDSLDVRARWSSTGDLLELSAPGVGILSTVPGGYASYSGTSMASPHVAGTAALVLSGESLTDLDGDGSVNNEDLRFLLRQTAEDLGAAGKDNLYGYGLVDADEAALPVLAAGTISGTVTDSSTGIGIAGAVITDGTRSVNTDESGNYVINDVPPGEYTVIVSAPGYQSASKTVTVQEALTSTADFILNESVISQATVDSIKYATIGGKNSAAHLLVTVSVVDGSGNPAAGAYVSITLCLDGSVYSTNTGTTGSGGTVSFKVPNAPPGTYTTTVTGVTAEGLTWDGVTPENSFVKN